MSIHQPVETPEWYVAVHNAGRTGYLLGPYPVQADAEANRDRARVLADRNDPWSHFYIFSLAAVPDYIPQPKPVFGA